MHTFLKINDPEVYAIPIQENNESLVDLRVQHREFFLGDARELSEEVPAETSFFRKSAAEYLANAAKNLPAGILFKIKEAHRPLETQRRIFFATMKRIQEENPDWSEAQVYEKTSTFVAPPDNTPPHSTGGAIDLTLMTVDGAELDMSTDSKKTGYTDACYTYSETISDQAKANRSILINVMQDAGFVNYPAEWWHWSYGDRYWAYMLEKPFAIYGSKEM